MITQDEVMPILLGVCPSFCQRWKEHKAFYDKEDLLYLDLSEFARHLIELYQGSQTGEFAEVFNAVERLHLEGDEFVREAAVIGLLEGIQNIAGNSGVDPESFFTYLQPKSRKWWRQLNDFWNGKIPYVGATINDA
jgi:hypothetical protein